MHFGLAGEFAKNAKLLVKACPTNWQSWNKRSEYVKTGAVLRSEREARGSDNAIMALDMPNGAQLIVSTIDFAPITTESAKLVSDMLANLGAKFSASNIDELKALDKESKLAKLKIIKSETQSEILKADANGIITLPDGVKEVSIWIYSPRSLVDLLAEPNMPVLDLILTNKARVELNGKNMAERSADGGKTFTVLPFEKGWNKITIKLENNKQLKAKFDCKNLPNFLNELLSSIDPRN